MDRTDVPTGTPKVTAAKIILKWDPNNPENWTRSVELIIEPLVIQVTTLVNTEGPSKKKKGQSKRAHALVAAIKKSTELFIERGEVVAHENLDIEQEMLVAVDEVRRSGEAMSTTAGEFADDPYSSLKRGNMVRVARNLLSAVTRLLILADMVDVHLLLKSLRLVEIDLKNFKNASSQTELTDSMRNFERNASELMSAAARRQREVKDSQLRDDFAAARALLKKHSTMLLTTSNVFVSHSEIAAANANRDFVIRQVCQALDTISDAAQGKSSGLGDPYDQSGDLATALDDFDESVIMEPLDYNEVRNRASLEGKLETIISGAILMADTSSTTNERREKIVAECNAVHQALQDLLSEYILNIGRKNKSQDLGQAIENLCGNTRGLRRQLRKAVLDQVFDSFMKTSVSLMVLIQAAEAGNEREFEDFAQAFTKYANKLGEVANLACSMPGNKDKVKMVTCAAAEIENLSPQVIIAARILTARPKSKVALENMEAFREVWENQVRILTEAVDDMTTIDDFLAVYEKHILKDLKKCVLVLQEGDAGSLGRIAGVIRGRASRVVSVVTSRMSNYEHGVYTEKVLEAVKNLLDNVMPKFAQGVKVAIEALFVNPSNVVDENKFIDASRLVYDGVREIRRAVLINSADDELDPEDFEFDEYKSATSGQTEAGDHNVNEYRDISRITNAQEALRRMTEAEKETLTQHIECFRTEKFEFDKEMSKWDDQGNDIIVIAKHMYMIMMEMTDFTLGRGPLKTTMDVINAAKKISKAGTKLDKLARQIADQCPESSTKNDLLAYLQRIPLYCHQLNITSKVKADVENDSGELIVQGLDSATSLIQAAKNLMNAMVLTVKSSYVASTKYPRRGTVGLPIVWKLKGSEKKPLLRYEILEEGSAKVHRGSQKKRKNPI